MFSKWAVGSLDSLYFVPLQFSYINVNVWWHIQKIFRALLGLWWFFLSLEWFTGQPIHTWYLALQVRMGKAAPGMLHNSPLGAWPLTCPALMPVMGSSWGFWSISGYIYLLLECGNRKRQISIFPWRKSVLVNEAFSHPSERIFSSCVHKMLVCDCGSSETEGRSTLLPPLSELRREGAVSTNFWASLFARFLSEVHFYPFLKESTKTWRNREMK